MRFITFLPALWLATLVTAPAALTDSLVGHWKMDSTSGFVATDSSGRGNHGDLKNYTAATWVPGRASNALAFNGTTNFVRVPNYPKTTNGLLSVAAWVWADTRPSWASIAKNWGDSSPGQFHFGLEGGGGQLSIYVQQADGAARHVNDTVALPTNSWQHVAFVADGARLRLYRNGVEVTNTAYDGTIRNPPTRPELAIGAKLNDLGNEASTSAPGFWDGNLDDLGIWNRALSLEEIAAIYNVGTFGRSLEAVTNASVTTLPASNLSERSAVLNARFNPNGSSGGWFFEWGTTTNYGNVRGPFPFLPAITNVTWGAFVAPLQPNTTYHYRAVVTNVAGRANGSNLSFTTLAPPAAATLDATGIMAVSATLRGATVPGSQPATVFFEWGATPGYGNVTPSQIVPAGSTSNVFTFAVSNLAPQTTYHFRAVATNALGRSNGADAAFTTGTPALPVLEALPATNVSAVAAWLQGRVTAGEVPATTFFEWGTTTNYGNTVAAPNVAAGTSPVTISASVTGLITATTYHFRAVASNAFGVARGADVPFVTTSAFLADSGIILLGADGAAAWGDYDSDGWLDMGLATFASLRLCRNGGNGSFAEMQIGPRGLWRPSFAWGDFDNDGDLDLVLTGDTSNGPITQLWRNLGGGSFTNIPTGLPGVFDGAVAWGDYDNDGRLDLVLTGTSSNGLITQLWRNLGGGSFTNSGVALPGLTDSAVAWGDYNNDGRLDLVLAGIRSPGPITQIWRNEGDGTFANIGAGLPGVYFGSVAWGDFDNDGRLDLALAGNGGTASGLIAQIWRNAGGDTFTNINAGLPGVQQGAVAWGDYDNDGRLDLALMGESNGSTSIAQVWRQAGDGSFTNIPMGLPASSAGTLAWGDYDNDGDLDLMLMESSVRVRRNEGGVPNTVPAAPAGLAGTSSSNGVWLRWNPASDAQTPAPGLGYNLRVGTAPGLGDIVSPMSRSDGRRWLPVFGRWRGTNAFLTGLTNGTYYWSVQAVDSALAGGPFAAEASFTVQGTVTPPALSVRWFGGKAVLSWPAEASAEFILECATNLAAPIWMIVPGVNGNVFTNQTPEAAKFFRLRHRSAFTSCEDAPFANRDDLLAYWNTPTRIDVLANDGGCPLKTLRVVSISGLAEHGVVAVAPDGSAIQYTPFWNDFGGDVFGYVISDGTNTASSTVTISVVNRVPVANNLTVDVRVGETKELVTASLFADPDAYATLTFVPDLTSLSHGTAALSVNSIQNTVNYLGTDQIWTENIHSLQYAAGTRGTDVIPYTVSDGALSSSGTITVNVLPLD